jgi:hypothetical protein
VEREVDAAEATLVDVGQHVFAARLSEDRAVSAVEWVERSHEYPDGAVARWRERPKPGAPGVVERVYSESPERFGPVITAQGATAGNAVAAPAAAPVPAAPAVRKSPPGPPIRRATGEFCGIEVLVHSAVRETMVRGDSVSSGDPTMSA